MSPDLMKLWQELGVEPHGDTVRLNEAAPLAAIRHAIMRPRDSALGWSASAVSTTRSARAVTARLCAMSSYSSSTLRRNREAAATPRAMPGASRRRLSAASSMSSANSATLTHRQPAVGGRPAPRGPAAAAAPCRGPRAGSAARARLRPVRMPRTAAPPVPVVQGGDAVAAARATPNQNATSSHVHPRTGTGQPPSAPH